tara:strand:+ start:177 stop:512 length:336 start_codon:yes stop_codon:yes gene_type:complete
MRQGLETKPFNTMSRVNFLEGSLMKAFIVKTWNSVMNARYNPLRHIPDENVRHLIMQILAWMWCTAFSIYMGSMWIFGFTALAHLAILAAVAITVATFEVAKRKPDTFIKK